MSTLVRRWFVEYNPLYLVSAALVLAGVITLSQELSAEGGALGQLSITAIVEIYAWALIGGAALLVRIDLRRPAVMLALLTALFQCDLTLQTARAAYLGVAGALGTAVWLASFIAKLYALAWAMQLRLSTSARAVPILGAVGLAAAPWVLRALEGPTATMIVGSWIFSVFAAGMWTTREVQGLTRLDTWSRTVKRRSLGAVWFGWAAVALAHVAFLASYGAGLDLQILIPIALVLAMRAVRSEVSSWLWLLATFAIVATCMPEHLFLTALMGAAVLVLRGLRRPTLADAAVEPTNDHPYRTEKTPAVEPSLTFNPSPRPELARLVTGAASCIYLAAWCHGWTGGPWPDHVVALDLVAVAAAALVLWRTRYALPLLPIVASATHLVVVRDLFPTPKSTTQWGVSSVAIGFALLLLSLVVSVRWKTKQADRPA